MRGMFWLYLPLALGIACVRSSDTSSESSFSPPPTPAEPPTPLTTAKESETARAILTAAEAYQGTEYVFGGRLGKRGCRRNGKPIRCREGIDCQSLIFFAFEEVQGKRWWDFSVMPTVNVKRGELGRPVKGLDGVLREKMDASKLAPGDVLFFLYEDYNLDVDGPLYEHKGRRCNTAGRDDGPAGKTATGHGREIRKHRREAAILRDAAEHAGGGDRNVTQRHREPHDRHRG